MGFTFIDQFNSRIGVLFHKSFVNDYIERKDFNNISASFQNFAVLKEDDCLSVQLPFEFAVQIPAQLLLELELNLLPQNVIELEFELSRM